MFNLATVCACAGKDSSILALCRERGEGVCVLQTMEISGKGEQAGSSIALFCYAEVCSDQVFHSVFTMRLPCLQLLVQTALVRGRLSSGSSEGIGANGE